MDDPMRLKTSSATKKQAMIRGERLPSLCGGSVELSKVMTSEESGDPQPLQVTSATTPNYDRDFLHMHIMRASLDIRTEQTSTVKLF